VYSDYRGFDNVLQVDTFKITIDGDNVDVNQTVITWPSNLADYGVAWVIQGQTAGDWTAVDMLAEDSLVLAAGVLERRILVIKTGAGPAGPVFAVTPTSLDFGVVEVGDTSAVQFVTFSNPSTTNPLGVTIPGDPDYIVSPLGGIVNAGQSLQVGIRFAPQAAGPGGNIEVTHTAAGSPFFITVTSAGKDTNKYLTLSPDTIIAKDPLKGKFFKPAKRGKGLAPNWANLLEEVVVQGGFQPLATGSDLMGGMVVGQSWVENVAGKVKVIKDSAKVRGWVRNSKWNVKKLQGKGYNDFQKTLEDKTGKHTGAARGYDVFVNTKPFLKEVKKPGPKKFNNKLYAELVALKFNIAASQLNKTPNGFGELIFDRDGNPFDEMSVLAISEQADTLMTYFAGVPAVTYDSLYAAVYDINRAFLGVMDTITFEAGAKLSLRGVENLTTFLKVPVGPVPTVVLAPTTDATEEEADFDETEFEDEDAMPVAAKLYQNYPNPFNPSTTIAFRLREASMVNIGVYNMLGQQVATLLSGEELDEGFNEVEFSGLDLASGVYFYRVDATSLENGARTVETMKMMLLK
jgi:hypothetical protein